MSSWRSSLPITGGTDYSLPRSTHPWLFASTVGFLLAFLFGIGVNFPFPYHAPRVSDLEKIRSEDWYTSTDATAARVVAAARLSMLTSAKRWNGWKARLLMAGFVAEFVGIALLGWVVRVVIAHA